MPAYSLSEGFKRLLSKKAKKDHDLKDVIGDALSKFGKEPVPNSLHFKPVPATQNRHYIRVPKRKGWRIIFRKLDLPEGTIYEAIDFGNHDLPRAER